MIARVVSMISIKRAFFMTGMCAVVLLVSLSASAQTAADFRLLDLAPVGAGRDESASRVLKWDGLVKTPEFGDIMATETVAMRVADLKRQNEQLPMPTIVRFYPRSVLREVYRVDFFYEDYEAFAGLRIVYRPFHADYSNKSQGIDIDAVVKQLSLTLGTPQTRIKRMVSGLPAYNAYQWEDDQVRILVDRESHHPGRPVVLQLNVKNTMLMNHYVLPE